MSFLQSSFNSEKKTEKPVLPSGYQDVGAGGGGGGGGDLKEDWLGLCYRNPSIFLTLFKAKCIKIAILFLNISLFSVLQKTLNIIVKMNTFFKIEVPINLY